MFDKDFVIEVINTRDILRYRKRVHDDMSETEYKVLALLNELLPLIDPIIITPEKPDVTAALQIAEEYLAKR